MLEAALRDDGGSTSDEDGAEALLLQATAGTEVARTKESGAAELIIASESGLAAQNAVANEQ